MPDDPKPPLAYERPMASPVTRRQFNWLLILLALHLLVTIQSTYAPDIRVGVKEWWAARQAAAARAAVVNKALAAEQRAMTWTEPPTKVVWEDDPEAGAKLVAAGTHQWISLTEWNTLPQHVFSHWPRGVFALPPTPLDSLQLNWANIPRDSSDLFFDNKPIPHLSDGVVLLHGLKSSAGVERLAYVYATGYDTFPVGSAGGELGPEAESWSSFFWKARTLVAIPFIPQRGEDEPRALRHRSTLLHIFPGHDQLRVTWDWVPDPATKSGTPRIAPHPHLRFYAGQPDPADPSGFTVAYAVDGQPGVIRGRLTDDDTIQLVPSTGKTVGDRWYPKGRTE